MARTLRTLRPDAAAKLDQLEVGASLLEQAVRNAIAEPYLPPSPPFARRLLTSVSSQLGPKLRVVRSLIVLLGRVVPHLAAALRFGRGLLVDAVKCIAVAFGVLLALALLIGLVAPPV